ncbi:MAG: PorP/SprF family type IX secretion system membrane protein [Chitinophagales bacterium]|nr:PorP/SprF family type IX secretion system membrane protein [Chitinophagales bacterium]MCB9020222.1 PorP/SprF family type IX secretion system membrane protein [Chitinophagales bacterium]MCB9020997.1 PorP/SprF family type IX secretion system membrane protein [Chitinophagales bacterium]HPE98579.1 PorP/SprF family type IX secretion system membrane protein [Chitinophagales bacterium]HPR28541.1 PorP/SprF family type IX secretion system membrane protein [Chitinophagales bacterium]
MLIACCRKAVSSFEPKVLSLLWFLALGHFSATFVQAQDLRFTQWHASDMVLNPAFAGAGAGGRFTANFRSQWPDMPQTYLSYRICYDQPISDVNSGFGIYMLQDDLGDQVLKNLNLGFQYMYQAKVSSSAAFNFGAQIGMVQRKLNWNQLQFYDQINPVYGFNNAQGIPNPTNEPQPADLSTTVLDLGLGAAFVTEKAYTGISFLHVNQPPNTFYDYEEDRLPMAISWQGGLFLKQKHRKRDPFMAEPTVQLISQGGFSQLQLGSYFAKSFVMGGFFLKNNFSGMSDVSILAGLKKDWILFTYSYDVTVGGLSGETGGSHEVGLIFRLDQAGKHSKGKYYSVLPRPSVF